MNIRIRLDFPHEWFAWRPVTIQRADGLYLVWLEKVSRSWKDNGFDAGWVYYA